MSRWKKDMRYAGGAKSEKTETFFSTHVRLITFLVTVGAFLLIFGPIFVLEAKDYFGQDNDARPKMQLDDVITLSEQESDIFKKQLTQYQCSESVQEGQNTTLIIIDIEPHYRLIATTNDLTGEVLVCTLGDGETGTVLDVLEDDVRAYFDQQ